MVFDQKRLDRALREVFGTIPPFECAQFAADASTRRYHRLRFEDRPETLVVMDLPENFMASDELLGGEPPKELPFLEVARLLESAGIDIPKIHAVDLDSRVLILEDLGDHRFEDWVKSADAEAFKARYEDAVALVAELHERLANPPAGSLVAKRRMDRSLLRWELDHFREYGLEELIGPLSAEDREALDADFDRLAEELDALPLGFVHRDVQSRNLMVRPDGSLALIDFQDAMRGPYIYDLVALLADSYIEMDRALRLSLVDFYAARRGLNAERVRREFDLQTVQRKLKDAGRFVFIDRVRGNPNFLKHFGSSLKLVGEALEALPEYAELSRRLSALIEGFPNAVPQPAPVSGAERGS